MQITIKRLPFKSNEKLVTEYWREHLKDWIMGADDIIRFTHNSIDNMWLYLGFNEENHCCGILVNEECTNSTLWLLHVIPTYRKSGFGTELFKFASEYVTGRWNVGSGTGYWWQGVPLGCGDDFLEKRGFHWSWTSIDMLLPLEDVKDIKTETEITITTLNPQDKQLLLDMLESEEDLSNWVRFYQHMAQDSKFNQILVAYSDLQIVGCVMVLEEQSIRWRKNFSGKFGGIGCLGVHSNYREQGIGAALVSAVHEQLYSLGYTHSYVSYTWLEKWYGKMGYQVVSRQRIGERSS